MKADTVAKHYGNLSAEERFRLILAAGARGDDAEQDRLTGAGLRLTWIMPDHAPYGHAFHEVALLIFIELLDEAARYLEAFAHIDDHDLFGPDEADDSEDAPDAQGDAKPADDVGERPIWWRSLDLALAFGFMLRTKAVGWQLFCERMTVPHFRLWEGLPGFDRLQRALALTEKAAFVPEGMVSWLNAARPAGEPKLTTVPYTIEGMASATESMYRQRVRWWGG